MIDKKQKEETVDKNTLSEIKEEFEVPVAISSQGKLYDDFDLDPDDDINDLLAEYGF